MKAKVFGVMALLAVLASVGLAMAMWTETLRINVYIDTGEVDLDFDAWCEEYPEDEGKDVGSCEAYVYTLEDGTPKVHVELDNLYPSYRFKLFLWMKNVGTIPVKIFNYSYTISGDDITSWLDCDTNATQVQLDPYDVNPDEQVKVFVWDCHVLQENAAGEELPENAHMEIHGEVVFAQWNEVPD